MCTVCHPRGSGFYLLASSRPFLVSYSRLLGESESQTGRPIEVHCAKAGDSRVFSPTALHFQVLSKFTSEASEEAEILGKQRSQASSNLLFRRCLQVKRERGKGLAPSERPL